MEDGVLKEGFLVKRVSALRPRARVAVGIAERAVAGRAGEAGERACWPTRPARKGGSGLVTVARGWLWHGSLKTT